jgi:hypothetical protein
LKPYRIHSLALRAIFEKVCLAVCSLLVVSQIASAEPLIRNLNLRGLQAGATTTLIVDGADLLPDPKLLLNVPIASQKVLEGATATRVQFEVTLDAQVTPGVYNLRIANPTGVSAPEIVAIDRLPQLAFAELIETLPATMHRSPAIRLEVAAGHSSARCESQATGLRLEFAGSP